MHVTQTPTNSDVTSYQSSHSAHQTRPGKPTKANACAGPRKPTSSSSSSRGEGLETRHVSGPRYVSPLFSFYFTLLIFIHTFPGASTHCQLTRTLFWTHQHLFTPPATRLNPPAPVLNPPGPVCTPNPCFHPQTPIYTHQHSFLVTDTPFHPPEPRQSPTTANPGQQMPTQVHDNHADQHQVI